MLRLIVSNSFPRIDFGGFENRKLANFEGGESISKSAGTFKLQISDESIYMEGSRNHREGQPVRPILMITSSTGNKTLQNSEDIPSPCGFRILIATVVSWFPVLCSWPEGNDRKPFLWMSRKIWRIVQKFDWDCLRNSLFRVFAGLPTWNNSKKKSVKSILRAPKL